MKYVALLSGGKDSCYNLLHCHQNGHELVVAASLGPAPGKEELDSYMYQTVGQDAIELVAQALDVPLIRRVIRGMAIQQGIEYGSRDALPSEESVTQGDETEDLFLLLEEVKRLYPDIQGVSVGAILSTYQRVRVEHVCRRLSLTPLCYLWRRDQAELLSEMVEAGLQAVLIKIAGIGLKPAHLGKSLNDMYPTLMNLNSLFGLHVCGEGGEYETLTLDFPLYKHRIDLIETEIVETTSDKFAPVAYLRVKSAQLNSKAPIPIQSVPVPPLLDDDYPYLSKLPTKLVATSRLMLSEVSRPIITAPTLSVPTEKRTGRWLALGEITAPKVDDGLSLEDEVSQCFQLLTALLTRHSLRLSDVANINIFISDMNLFPRINVVYASFFGTSPPARACVAIDLPSPVRVKLDCIAFASMSPLDRHALHVQGLSYWAPANIGPYSQAIAVDEGLFISGQIGLLPKTLTLPDPRSLAMETKLSTQHISRIVSALRETTGSNWTPFPMLNIFWYDCEDNARSVASRLQPIVPSLHVTVQALPKSALIENQAMYYRENVESMDNSQGGERETYSYGAIACKDTHSHNWVWYSKKSNLATTVICVKGDFIADQIAQLEGVAENTLNALSVRVFLRAVSCVNFSSPPLPINLKPLFGDTLPSITTIPCRSLISSNAEDCDFALVILSVFSNGDNKVET